MIRTKQPYKLVNTIAVAFLLVNAGCSSDSGDPAKAAQTVKVGDIVKVRLHGFDKIYEVTGLASRRGSAEEAAKHFADHTPPPLPKEERAIMPIRDRGAGRPSKRERRDLDKLRGHDSSEA